MLVFQDNAMTFGALSSLFLAGVYMGHELVGYDTIHLNRPFSCFPGGTLALCLFFIPKLDGRIGRGRWAGLEGRKHLGALF